MFSSDTIFADLERAEEGNDLTRCMELCREALAQIDVPRSKEMYFKLQFRLANYLVADGKDRGIEEAIDILTQLLLGASGGKTGERLAHIHLALGFAFGEKVLGEKRIHFESTIRHYEEALKFFTRDTYPEKWASIKAGIGLAYAEKAGQNDVVRAIENYLDTLDVYTKQEYLEDYEDSIRELGKLKKRLSDDVQWAKLMESFEV